MDKPNVLYVSQEIFPYLPESPIAKLTRVLPQSVTEKGNEIRTFMPRFGNVNERRNQLHEVIRLSGLNVVIDDTDHPLIIKVASIQAARMQIYFIDNEDFFARKATVRDSEGKEFDDNDERAIFFARGVLETTKKLRWIPDVVHLHGWFTMIIPIFLRFFMQDDPAFKDCKIIVSLHDEGFSSTWNDLNKKIWVEGINEKELKKLQITDFTSLMKTAIDLADGVTICSENASAELIDYARLSGKPVLDYPGEVPDATPKYLDFYNLIKGQK